MKQTFLETNNTEHFIAYYDETEKQLAEEFITLLEKKYEEIHKEFVFSNVEEKYHFYLCKDAEEFIKITGKSQEEYQPWMVGNTNQESHTIAIISPNAVSDRSQEDMEKVAVHELVHMIFDDATNMSGEMQEPWIAEGIAVLHAEQTNLDFVSCNACPEVAEISGGFDNFVNNNGYDYAGIYVWYFIKKYGFEEFLRAYRNECEWWNLIYTGFEVEAIEGFLAKKL